MKHFASLKDARNFIRVFKQGKTLRGAYFRVHYLRNEVAITRIGIVVTRKAGSAVSRNLIRRRLRCILFNTVSTLKSDLDIVFYVNSSIVEIPYKEIEIETYRILNLL